MLSGGGGGRGVLSGGGREREEVGISELIKFKQSYVIMAQSLEMNCVFFFLNTE